ncbi:MAG: DUF4118 domain-containing protein [Candidatus Solibacter sp.]
MTLVAGRIAGVSLTVVACGFMAFFMPPTFSLRVARNADIAVLVVQSVAGIVVTQTTRRKGRRQQQADAITSEPLPLSRRQEGSRIADVIARLLEKDAGLWLRSADLHVEVDQDQRIKLSEHEFDRILTDILRLAFARNEVTGGTRSRRVSIYAAHRPSCDRISVSAEYDLEPTLPRVRIVGRNDDQCKRIPTSGWPPRCSATWFDNGFEYIYQVAIQKPVPCDSNSFAAEHDDVSVTRMAR